ncbi:hypothetical protein, partial [Altibacter sp.]|uniref:hypothetical protein n=1 Tax=Altibacter sp. TaxID=2024823 RepID=UPI00258D1B19
MKKLLKPARIGFYILMLITFFVVGLYYAGFIEAGKNQGLAGGAIVLGWGVLFGGVAFIAAFFIAYYLEIGMLVRINWVLLIALFSLCGYKYYQFQQRDALREETNEPFERTPTKTTQPTAYLSMDRRNKKVVNRVLTENDSSMGMGYFSPNYFDHPTL